MSEKYRVLNDKLANELARHKLSVSLFLDNPYVTIVCACKMRDLFIDVLAHPEGFYACECGFYIRWYVSNGVFRFRHSYPA